MTQDQFLFRLRSQLLPVDGWGAFRQGSRHAAVAAVLYTARRFAVETVMHDSLIGVRLEQYEVERLLGVGGMAHVYLARDISRNASSQRDLTQWRRFSTRQGGLRWRP